MKQYLMSLCVVCILFSVMSALVTDKKWKKILDYMCSLVLILVVISPLFKIDLNEIEQYFDLEATEFGWGIEENAYEDDILCSLIKERSEEYILEEALRMGMEVEAHVVLGDGGTYQIPIAVQICGSCSDFEKEVLSTVISNDLGIPPEKQIWNSE